MHQYPAYLKEACSRGEPSQRGDVVSVRESSLRVERGPVMMQEKKDFLCITQLKRETYEKNYTTHDLELCSDLSPIHQGRIHYEALYGRKCRSPVVVGQKLDEAQYKQRECARNLVQEEGMSTCVREDESDASEGKGCKLLVTDRRVMLT
ncbi:hypothetical protein Tco_1484496 [Tanacetum coccineum]